MSRCMGGKGVMRRKSVVTVVMQIYWLPPFLPYNGPCVLSYCDMDHVCFWANPQSLCIVMGNSPGIRTQLVTSDLWRAGLLHQVLREGRSSVPCSSISVLFCFPVYWVSLLPTCFMEPTSLVHPSFLGPFLSLSPTPGSCCGSALGNLRWCFAWEWQNLGSCKMDCSHRRRLHPGQWFSVPGHKPNLP